MKRHSGGTYTWLTFDLLEEVRHGVFLHHGEPTSREAVLALGFERYLFLHLEHGNNVVDNVGDVHADGVMTDEKGVALVITHADCQAALFYDPEHQAVAAVHCGWRGSVKNIYRETVEKMGKRYGTRAEALKVGISPSLGPQAAEFRHYRDELPETFWSFQVTPNYFDFWEISRWQLRELGVRHLEIAKICTYHDDECFSYRRDHACGRHVTLVGLL